VKHVLKYPLPDVGDVVDVPEGQVVLFGAKRNSSALQVWVEVAEDVDLGEPAVTQHLQVFGTGWFMPAAAEWVASTIDEPFVWHLYRLPEGSVTP
jgi:hypothetical protein